MKLTGYNRPLIMAHRGDSAAAPENTLLSLRRAVEIGVDFLETDVRLTKDNEFVLFHDDTLERTTGDSGTIRDKTLEELKQIDLGYNFTLDDGKTFPCRGQGHTIVTLGEAFDAFPEMMFNIDIKDKERIAPDRLAILINHYDRESSVLVGSFHDVQAYTFRKIMANTMTSACPSEVTRFVFALKMRVLGLFTRKCQYEAFQVPMKYGRIQVVDERFVKAAHDRDIAVHVWTINDRVEMEHLIDLGVDGIFTDEPMLLRNILLEKGLL
ncbi:MAG: glycerophosphodiester phosphodiesterase [Candidatus Thorarchaeota archaeon]|nr:glycerophosphodiester phosphodiesterase [Candidatus Thorarchaeota archaeon]